MVNLDIVSGFLGAGKTTFIQILLKHYIDKGEKVVYIVNEFGEAGVDGLLMKNDGFNVFELANGCICCTLKAEFAAILKDLLDTTEPDRIVFEPSGIFVFADFYSFLRNEWIRKRCRVNNVITIVDAVNFPEFYASTANIIEDQILNSGTIVISKTQLNGAMTEEILCDLRNISQNINIITTPWDDFTPELLDRALETWPVMEHIGTGVLHKMSKHIEFESATLKLEPFDTYDNLVGFTRKITSGGFGCVVRAKGFMRQGENTYLVNIVGSQCDITPYSYTPGSVFTLLGTNLLIKIQTGQY